MPEFKSPKDRNKSISPATAGKVLGQVAQRSMYSTYRVVVYRIDMAGLGTYAIDKAVRSYDEIFNADPITERYLEQADWFSEDQEKRVKGLLESYYGALHGRLTKELDSDGKTAHTLFKGNAAGSLLKEYDITPLVTSVTTSINLDAPNGCALSMINPTLASYNLSQLRSFNTNQWLNLMKKLDPQAADLKALYNLKSFKLREYDLIRVFMYNGEKPLSKELGTVIDAIKDVDPKVQADKQRFAVQNMMPVAFTGLVVSISDNNAVDQVARINVECNGMMRVLANTSTVTDQSLCNQIAMQNRFIGEDLSMEDKAITVWQNFYADKDALSCFTSILDEYFKPDPVKDSGTVVGGAPSIFRLVEAMYPRSSSGSDGYPIKIDSVESMGNMAKTPSRVSPATFAPSHKSVADSVTWSPSDLPVLPPASFVQLLNTLLAYHILKAKSGELIYYIDDEKEKYNVVTYDGLSSQDVSGNNTILRPYMLMTKSGFQTYDATYQSPLEVLETVKRFTFMEVFEDRCGTFRFRFPRYNSAIIDKSYEFKDLVSVMINRSDSGNMNVVQAKWMVDMVGALNAVPSRVYVDPISVFKYGTRVTENIENPNCVSPGNASAFAKFYRYYHIGANARYADITAVGDPFLSPGHMVSFSLGYSGKQNAGISGGMGIPDLSKDGAKSLYASSNIAGGSTSDYVGYATTVSDTLNVDGFFTQKVTAKFVRDASLCPVKDLKISSNNTGVPDAILRRSGTGGLDLVKYPISVASKRSEYLSPSLWVSEAQRPATEIGVFQNMYSVQDLANRIFPDLETASAFLKGGSPNGVFKSETFCDRLPQFLEMLDSHVQAWVDNRAVVAAVIGVLPELSGGWNAYRLMGKATPIQEMLSLSARVRLSVANAGNKVLGDMSKHKITTDMGPSDAAQLTFMSSPGSLNLFLDGDLEDNIVRSQDRLFSSQDKPFDFKMFVSSLHINKDDKEFFENETFLPMELIAMLELTEQEMRNAVESEAKTGKPTSMATKEQLRKNMSQIYRAIFNSATSWQATAVRKMNDRIVGTVSLRKHARTLVRMQKACAERKAAEDAAKKAAEIAAANALLNPTQFVVVSSNSTTTNTVTQDGN